jgi:hypothetical protein
MATLTYSQIQQLWISNGGSRVMAPVMAAIALAESGGRTNALNSTAPDYSVGLWQINYYGSMLPGRTKAYGSPSALMGDPNLQAKAAIAIEHGQGLSAWSTYTNGAFKKFLNGSSTSALPDFGTSQVDNVSGSSVQAAGLQQAGYDAVIDLTPYGIPLNPFKLPGWLGGKLGGSLCDSAGGALGAAGGAMWDAIGPVVLAGLGVAMGAAVVVMGLYVTAKPAVDEKKQEVLQVASAAPIPV